MKYITWLMRSGAVLMVMALPLGATDTTIIPDTSVATDPAALDPFTTTISATTDSATSDAQTVAPQSTRVPFDGRGAGAKRRAAKR